MKKEKSITNIKKSTNNKQVITHKSKLSFPLVSLSQLQQIINPKHIKSKSNLEQHSYNIIYKQQELINQLQIKSPFYERNKCKKLNCPCQYHKRQKPNIPKILKSIKNKNNYKININMTEGNQIHNVYNQSQGYNNTLRIYQHQDVNHSNDKPKCTINKSSRKITFKDVGDDDDNQKQYDEMRQAEKRYQQYLREIKKQTNYLVDCHNLTFQQFLRIHRPLQQPYQVPSQMFISYQNINSKKSIVLSSSNLSHKHNSPKSKKLTNHKYRPSGLNIFTEPNQEKKIYSFSRNIHLLSLKDRQEYQRIIKEFYRDLDVDLELQLQDQQKFNFFSLICDKLTNDDRFVSNKAKLVLAKISQLKINMFKTVFKDIKQDINQGIVLNRQFSPQFILHAIDLALSFIQNRVQTLIQEKKQKQGKKKLQIIKKMKNKYAGRLSLDFYRKVQAQRLQNYSKSTNNIQSFNNSKNKPSKFYTKDQVNNYFQTSQQDDQNTLLNQQNKQGQYMKQNGKKHKSKLMPKQNSMHHVKKGKNLKFIKNKNDMIKKIDQQIDKQNQQELLRTTNSQKVKITEQIIKKPQIKPKSRLGFIKNRQFFDMVTKFTKQKKQLQLEEYEERKSTIQSHFRKNRHFISKIQGTLKTTQLNQIAIKFQDNLITKKRKIRLLKNLIQDEQISQKTAFESDLQKYVQIYEKNCNLVINKKKNQNHQLHSNQHTHNQSQTKINHQQDLCTQDYKVQSQLLNDLTKFLNNQTTQNLKFYNLKKLNLLDDSQSLMIKIPTSISQTKNIKSQTKYHFEIQETNNTKQNDSYNILIQKDMPIRIQKTQPQVPQIMEKQNYQINQNKDYQINQNKDYLINQNKDYLINQSSNKDITSKMSKQMKQNSKIQKLRNKFDRKLSKYRNIFRSCEVLKTQPY